MHRAFPWEITLPRERDHDFWEAELHQPSKKQKANVLNPILRNPSPPFLLHNVSHMSLPSHIHIRQAGVGEAQVHSFKTKLLSFCKSLEVALQLSRGWGPSFGTSRSLYGKGNQTSGIKLEWTARQGPSWVIMAQKRGIGLCMGSVSQKCTAKAVSGVSDHGVKVAAGLRLQTAQGHARSWFNFMSEHPKWEDYLQSTLETSTWSFLAFANSPKMNIFSVYIDFFISLFME